MNKQLISVLTIATTSLFVSAGSSHAEFNPAAPSLDPAVKTVDEPGRSTRAGSDTFTAPIKEPIKWWMCVTTIGGQVDCHWVADPA